MGHKPTGTVVVRGRDGATPSRPPGLDPAATTRRGRPGPSLGPGRSRAPFVRPSEHPVEHKGVDTNLRGGRPGRNGRPACSTPQSGGFEGIRPSNRAGPVSRFHGVDAVSGRPEAVVGTPGRTARAPRRRGTVHACRVSGRTTSHGWKLTGRRVVGGWTSDPSFGAHTLDRGE